MKLKKLQPPETNNKVAIVSIAHADDLLLFCGGAVATLIKSGWQVSVVRATNDRWDSYDLDENATIQANSNDFKAVTKLLGIHETIDLTLDTDQLGDYSEVNLRSHYIDLIRKIKPYLVVTFDPDSYLYEDNEDHRKLAISMAEAMWASGFDKHPGAGVGEIKPFLPVARWYFGREVPKPTHILDVSSHIDLLIEATSLHKTMLINMARQWWLKGDAANVSLSEFFDRVKMDTSFFAELIIKKGRQKKASNKKFIERYRVIDDFDVVSTLSRLRRS